MILLVIPRSPFLLDEKVFPSLGILKVGAALQQAGEHVEVLDLSGREDDLEAFRSTLTERQPTAVGLTATTPQLPSVFRLMKVARGAAPEAKFILGGPHATLVNAAAKREHKRGKSGRAFGAYADLRGAFDVVVAGDGERAIFEALKGDNATIDADDPKSDLWVPEEAQAELWPARHLIDLKSYRYTIDSAIATSVIMQLACPYECAYCGGRYSPMLRRARFRDSASAVHEIEYLHDTWGFTGIQFYDDELNISGRRLVELCQALTQWQRRRGIELRLRGFVKAELFDESQARAMYDAGFRWILCGFESAHPRILDNINKKATLEDNTRCLRIARAAGLKVKALMSLGQAGESRETIAATRDWLLAEKPDDFDATIITTYPGTPYYDDAEKQPEGHWTYRAPRTGDALHAIEIDYRTTADYYKGDPAGGYKSYVFTDHISAEDLVRERDALEAEVRGKLGIPWPTGAAKAYDHSMGQR